MSYDLMSLIHYILSNDNTLAGYTDSQIHRGTYILQDDKLTSTQHCAIFVPLPLSERLEPYIGNSVAINHTLIEVNVVAKRSDGGDYGLNVARRVRNLLNATTNYTYNGEIARLMVFDISIEPQWEPEIQFYRFVVRGKAQDGISLS